MFEFKAKNEHDAEIAYDVLQNFIEHCAYLEQIPKITTLHAKMGEFAHHDPVTGELHPSDVVYSVRVE